MFVIFFDKEGEDIGCFGWRLWDLVWRSRLGWGGSQWYVRLDKIRRTDKWGYTDPDKPDKLDKIGCTSKIDKIWKTSEISKFSGSKFLAEHCHSAFVGATRSSTMFVIFFDKECKDIGSFGRSLRNLVWRCRLGWGGWGQELQLSFTNAATLPVGVQRLWMAAVLLSASLALVCKSGMR